MLYHSSHNSVGADTLGQRQLSQRQRRAMPLTPLRDRLLFWNVSSIRTVCGLFPVFHYSVSSQQRVVYNAHPFSHSHGLYIYVLYFLMMARPAASGDRTS
jgi:hypothetical protein